MKSAFRFIQFICLLVACMIQEGSALASRSPKTTASALEQQQQQQQQQHAMLFGAYSYGEGQLLGGSDVLPNTKIWAGKKNMPDDYSTSKKTPPGGHNHKMVPPSSHGSAFIPKK